MPRGICRPTISHVCSLWSVVCGLFLTGCCSVTERFENGQLVSRQTITWSISPRALETTPTTATVIVTDTAETLRAIAPIAEAAAKGAVNGAITP